jgi:hypothetical protein
MGDDPRKLPEQLRALGRELSVRVPDDLADRVVAEIALVPVKRTTGWRRWGAGLAALVVAAGVSVAVSAPVRAALGQVFGFGGVEVRQAPGPSPASTPSLPDAHRTDIDTAQAIVGFAIRVPRELGEPESVTVADGRVVSLYYTQPTGPVRIDQFEGDLGAMWAKYAQGLAQPTTVDGLEALWFDEPVTLVYIDSRGVEREESSRLTDGTLVWMEDGLTFRLDGIRPLDAAVTVARSMS